MMHLHQLWRLHCYHPSTENWLAQSLQANTPPMVLTLVSRPCLITKSQPEERFMYRASNRQNPAGDGALVAKIAHDYSQQMPADACSYAVAQHKPGHAGISTLNWLLDRMAALQDPYVQQRCQCPLPALHDALSVRSAHHGAASRFLSMQRQMLAEGLYLISSSSRSASSRRAACLALNAAMAMARAPSPPSSFPACST